MVQCSRLANVLCPTLIYGGSSRRCRTSQRACRALMTGGCSRRLPGASLRCAVARSARQGPKTTYQTRTVSSVPHGRRSPFGIELAVFEGQGFALPGHSLIDACFAPIAADGMCSAEGPLGAHPRRSGWPFIQPFRPIIGRSVPLSRSLKQAATCAGGSGQVERSRPIEDCARLVGQSRAALAAQDRTAA